MSIKKNFQRSLLLVPFLISVSLVRAGSGVLQVVPETFDFGWCPLNAKISATFSVKNTSQEIVPVTGVQPTCGCTAANFTPADLASMGELTVGLTFNTRGYDGRPFNKPTKVQTQLADEDTTVYLKGHVTQPDALVLPAGTGVAAYEPGTGEKQQTIEIVNKASHTVTLTVVQAPEEWARVKLSKKSIRAKERINLVVTVDPPYDSIRNTSVTLEGIERSNVHRFTVAIRTGPYPPPVGVPVKKEPKPLNMPVADPLPPDKPATPTP